MQTPPQPEGLAAKPGALGELVLTLPIFLAYQLGVVFLKTRNAADLVTGNLLAASNGDRLTYLGLTAAIGVVLTATLGTLGRRESLRFGKVLQIAVEGAAYAIAMGAATSWIVGKVFAGSARAVQGPLAGLVMSLGAGFYEELAFRVILFGVGAKVLVWLFARERFQLVGVTPALGLRSLAVIVAWGVVCAAVFSGLHYIGPLGDSFDMRSYVARAVLGLMLTVVYSLRGFAAAVWTHALYDIWVLAL
jgi:hypothetical protein